MPLKNLLMWIAVAVLLAAGVFLALRPLVSLREGRAPVKVIFDTDMLGDCDDAGAMALLHKLVDSGEAEILAVVVNSDNTEKAVGAAVDVINTYYGRPDIPLGAYHGTECKQMRGNYTVQLRDEFPHDAPSDDKLPSALTLYRKTLAEAADGEVVIISVGFLFNLRDLLNSPADEISPLTGEELVRRKVKELVLMGGQFPQSDPKKGEFNFAWTQPLCAKDVMARWPTPVLLSGFEIGKELITGQPLAATPPANPVRRAYELFRGNCLLKGRQSWDLTAVLAAVRDPQIYWTLSEPGTCMVSDIGTNTWLADPSGKHRYLIRKVPVETMVQLLNDFMVQPPLSGFPPAKPAADAGGNR